MADRAPAAERLDSILQQYGRILRAAIARVCPAELAGEREDIEQEARVRVWRTLCDERRIDQPASFLYRVAVTATLDAIRRAKSRGGPPEQLKEEELGGEASAAVSSDRPTPEEQAQRREALRGVFASLKQMPEKRRRAVSLHLQGFTTGEIGELLSWSEPKARNLVSRGLRQLRERLKEEGIHYEMD